MQRVFIGSEALAVGTVTRHGLARWHRRVHPDVYFPKFVQANLHDKIMAAWLWGRRQGVVAGVAASAVHGAEWVDPDTPIELVSAKSHPPRGVIVRNETVAADEIITVRGLPVTTVERTAFDLARHLPRGAGLARLDALLRAAPFRVDRVLDLAQRYPGARGVQQFRQLLPLVDGGAESPRESRLRLLLIDAGFPIPATQIPVYLGQQLFAVLDMGWEDFGVSAEYDGDVHRTVRRAYVRDHHRERELPKLGWRNVRVIKEDTVRGIIDRVAKALWSRGWRGQPVYPARSR